MSVQSSSGRKGETRKAYILPSKWRAWNEFVEHLRSFEVGHFVFLTTLLQNAKYETSERARIHSLGRSLFLPSLGRRLLFVLPLTNAQLRKMSSSGSASVKHNEIIMR